MATKHLTYIFLFFGNLTLDIQAQKDFCLQLNQNGLIFCDDFESGKAISTLYFEHNNNNGDFVPMPAVGRDASTGMRVLWQKDEVAAGGLSKSFGRTPQAYIGRNAAMPDSTFMEFIGEWMSDIRMVGRVEDPLNSQGPFVWQIPTGRQEPWPIFGPADQLMHS
ncbi:MAG: hypothetical protein IPO62_09875 [Saprospiraceae bacterium]|nr:hypothetical protein [Saprospiraceae bacterium]